jgi:hypothetical protein
MRSLVAIGAAVLLLAGTLGLATTANAASSAISVSGHQEVSLGGVCPAGTFVMSGDLEGCWTTDSFNLVAAGPNGIVVGSGTETFVGCIGERCGSLFLTFVFVGRFDAAGVELWGGCHHPIRGGAGDFAGARGVLNFVDDPDDTALPPADYSGRIVLGS